MIEKDSVFAQAGAQDPNKTMADFRQGMIPNTVAMAEDVNTYGNWSDRDLKVVCDELVNALVGQGIQPNNSYQESDSNQLDTLLKTKLNSGFMLTGLVYSSYTTAPTQVGASITFPAFQVAFNSSVYYGNTQQSITVIDVPAQTVVGNASWAEGVNYVYVTPEGNITHQETLVLAADGATKCYLGSLFIVNSAIQADSWNFSPWLQITSPSDREAPTPSRKGGYLTPAGGLTLDMGPVEILSEGINFGNNPQKPSIRDFQGSSPSSPFTYKYIYPTYDPSVAATSTIDTTHLYNMSTNTWDDISAFADKYICIVPCITPSGQTLMVPAMSYKTGDTYDAIFDTVEEARNAVYGLQYKMNRRVGGEESDSRVDSRSIYLGQTLIVKIGATDFTVGEQFANVGQVPQALAGFTEATGQTGGGAGAYIPMPSQELTDSATILANYAYEITGRTDHPILVTLPNPTPNIINQFELHYVHQNGMQGLSFNTSGANAPVWWGQAPTWVAGTAYNIIGEYVAGKWRLGYLSMGA